MLLRQIIADTPTTTLKEVTAAFCARRGRSVHSVTISRRLRQAGVTRQRRPAVVAEGAPAPRYGYRPSHRRQ